MSWRLNNFLFALGLNFFSSKLFIETQILLLELVSFEARVWAFFRESYGPRQLILWSFDWTTICRGPLQAILIIWVLNVLSNLTEELIFILEIQTLIWIILWFNWWNWEFIEVWKRLFFVSVIRIWWWRIWPHRNTLFLIMILM